MGQDLLIARPGIRFPALERSRSLLWRLRNADLEEKEWKAGEKSGRLSKGRAPERNTGSIEYDAQLPRDVRSRDEEIMSLLNVLAHCSFPN